MENLRLKYPLSFALIATIAVVLCFSLIPSWSLNQGFVDYGTFRQTITIAVILAAAYLFSGEWQLESLALSPDNTLHANNGSNAKLPLPTARPFPLSRVFVVLGVAAFAVGLLAVYAQGSIVTPPRSAIIMFIILLAGAAVFEEILFRGFFFEAFAKVLYARGVGKSLLIAALASSFLFGILHVSSDLGALFRPAAYIQAAVKVVEAMLFGLVMCALYIKTRSVWSAVCAHFVFNVLSELPIYGATGVQKFSYITGSPADITVLLLGCVILLPAAKWAWDYLA